MEVSFVMENRQSSLHKVIHLIMFAVLCMMVGYLIGSKVQIATYEAAVAESEAKLQIGEYDGIVIEKAGGEYTIRSLNSYSEYPSPVPSFGSASYSEYKIVHDVYTDARDFPVGTFVRFSFNKDDPAEYKHSNLLLHLSEETLSSVYEIYGDIGAESYRNNLGL